MEMGVPAGRQLRMCIRAGRNNKKPIIVGEGSTNRGETIISCVYGDEIRVCVHKKEDRLLFAVRARRRLIHVL